MTAVKNTIQSTCEAPLPMQVVQSPEIHLAVEMLDQPENGFGIEDPTLVPEMADMINTDPEEENVHNDNSHGINVKKYTTYLCPPGIEDTLMAHNDLKSILKPKRKTGAGYLDPGFDLMTRERLEQIHQFLWNYADPGSATHGNSTNSLWMATSEWTAHTLGRGTYLARNLRKWACAFIIDRKDLPINVYGQWNESILFEDKTLAQEIVTHLQGIGKYAKAMDIVQFLDTPDMKKRLNRKTTIHLATAQHWMHKMEFCWANTPKGQYVDGHEREDVIEYRQNGFLHKLTEIDAKLRTWTKDGLEEPSAAAIPTVRHTVVWYHDESVFYANDRRKQRWVGKNETPVPQPKGEGPSLMVADFISADYGWLRSPNGEENVWVLLKPGKSWGGGVFHQ